MLGNRNAKIVKNISAYRDLVVALSSPSEWDRIALSLVVGGFAFALEPAGYSMGLPKQMLAVQAVSIFLYLIALPLLLDRVGLVGAGMAALLFQLIWVLGALFVQRGASRKTI